MRAVYTEAIPLDKMESHGKVTVGLMPLPSSLELVDDTFQNVTVRYRVEQRKPLADEE